MRNEFACPHCAASLSASNTKAIVVVIALWMIADIPVHAFAIAVFGYDGAVALAGRILASGAVGVLIAYVVGGRLSTVAARGESR